MRPGKRFVPARPSGGDGLTSKAPAELDGPDLPGGSLPAASPEALAGCELERATLTRLDFAGQRGPNLRLDQCRLKDVDVTSAELEKALLQDCAVTGGSWANVRTRELRLRRVEFGKVRMTGLDLPAAELEDVAFLECRMDLSTFHEAKLNRVAFRDCQLDEIDFSEARLTSVTFSNCRLTRSVWTGTLLRRCEMRGCDIGGLVSPERLRGVRMRWEDVLASAGALAAAVGIEIVE
jgi:uncharacterized protein YjbI with pentapeptide repeats